MTARPEAAVQALSSKITAIMIATLIRGDRHEEIFKRWKGRHGRMTEQIIQILPIVVRRGITDQQDMERHPTDGVIPLTSVRCPENLDREEGILGTPTYELTLIETLLAIGVSVTTEKLEAVVPYLRSLDSRTSIIGHWCLPLGRPV